MKPSSPAAILRIARATLRCLHVGYRGNLYAERPLCGTQDGDLYGRLEDSHKHVTSALLDGLSVSAVTRARG